MTPIPPLDPYLSPQGQQAVIAGLFLAIGWWVVALQNRRRDAKLRENRVRDVQRALFAEIRANVAALRREDLETYGETIARRIEDNPGFFPTIPTESNDAIFRAIIAEIHVLPRDTIDPIVLYYRQLDVIGAAIDDLRVLDVDLIGPERAADLYRDYINFRLEALDLGEDAMIAIAKDVDGTGRGDMPAAVSNPDAVRSGQESGRRP
ncbi:MAG: hypothetical protein ACU0DB_03465 [Paracoccus sp. (in: a-proteobacteria)]|uniref:hypothetical protein n=1 Tax=unclassified Paracoccus (in: a-proteobacteria) TaxID=2688777 RepID=UPI000C657FD2|nr:MULTISPECIES: hypothetical protein [unclassified Paracoccus (in: a-proteobacteria)]MAN57170.1 hypothetical protein [Paracoccus sp. (in: a-proteobacteria)]|tara:strand:+ start:771 stop:1391 length:621 start_codon:yes stop_codon:yes gene_type:complete